MLKYVLEQFRVELPNKVLVMSGCSEINASSKSVLAIVSLLAVFLAPIFSHGALGNEGGQTRNCSNAWSVDDSDNMTNSDGTFFVTVERVSSNAAIFVEDGELVSSTILNDIVSNWDSIIFPSTTNYFGNPPDIDGNCQIEIAILAIDGPGGEEGYFEWGISSLREVIFLDIDDLPERNRIMAHELEQLIHYGMDPSEYIWIDEGAAELSEFLSYGASPELEERANSWTTDTSTSLRWWDERDSDRGASFLFMAYLEDKLGGSTSMRQLISDGSIGGNGIENLARNPGPGASPIGTSMSDIFANFSAAITLDSAQGAFGFDDIDLVEDCSSEGFCMGSTSAENNQWSETWQSSGHLIEGWGFKSFRFSQGDGYPLSILVQPDRFGFEGAILSKEDSSGTWAMEKLRVDADDGKGTGLVHGFGNTTSEVFLIVWYNSIVDDCDFEWANCGILSGAYPTGSFTVSASQVTSPAEVSIDSIVGFDRDGDSQGDSVEIGISISSSAFSEILSVEFSVFINNTLYDSSDFFISVGNSEPETRSVWFSPPFTGEWSFTVKVRDITGELQDIAQTLTQQIYNMKPVGSGSISSNQTQTWVPTYIFGGGYDSWGFGFQNGSFEHNETPQSYIWEFGDGNSSSLKNPVHSYSEVGDYVITLLVRDQGGYFSESISWGVSVNDTSEPIPEIAVDGLAIQDGLTVQTNQRIQFSAFGTSDNVPNSELFFSWDWGDGSADSGTGLFEVGHSWGDGSGDGTVYPLELTVSDGRQASQKTLLVKVLNREPRQIFSEKLEAFAVTPLSMPEVFVDEDGIIVEYRWTFEDGVNLGDQSVSLASDFSETSSFEENPMVSWKEPGMKNVTLEVSDDDGNTSIAYLEVEILNQRPVALFERPPDGEIGDAYVFISSSFDPDGDSSSLSHYWTFSDREDTIENTTSISRTFSAPGLYSVTLVVFDERGLDSAPKTFLLYIENPLPVPIVSFSCPSDGNIMLSIIPDNEEMGIIWKVPMTVGGGAFVGPGDIIRFDGSESFDADPEFEGMASVDIDDPDWNGIVEWIWDFGDASPPSSGPEVWHSYERAGEYTVRLTVIDGFGGGDSNTTEIKVIVSDSPVITSTRVVSTEYVVVGELVNLSGAAFDPDLDRDIEAWMDEDALFDSDGDGDPTNDRDMVLNGPLRFFWDIDAFIDEDCNTPDGCDGNSRNDWITPNQTWGDPGEVRIAMSVCDGVDVCQSRDYVITVISVEDSNPPKTLSDLKAEDLIPGRDRAGLLFLVTMVAILGWMILREKDEDELDAMDNAKKYDVDEVEAEGGLPGMDQHRPPPQPRYLTADQRTNSESGYVRPIRTRRRS